MRRGRVETVREAGETPTALGCEQREEGECLTRSGPFEKKRAHCIDTFYDRRPPILTRVTVKKTAALSLLLSSLPCSVLW